MCKTLYKDPLVQGAYEHGHACVLACVLACVHVCACMHHFVLQERCAGNGIGMEVLPYVFVVHCVTISHWPVGRAGPGLAGPAVQWNA